MSFKYQAVDLSLAVSCRFLPLLHDVSSDARALVKVMSVVVFNRGSVGDLDTLLQLACFRLWQMIVVSLG